MHALSGPELYPETERNAIIAKLNQLLAANGVGNGYYKDGQNPVVFDINNPFHRLKAVGYNRLSEHKDSDGIVSLVLKVAADQVATSQQKQKVIAILKDP